MRTTLDLDDDVLEAVRALARAERRSQGAVLSDLARRALRPEPVLGTGAGGAPTFAVSGDAPPITLEKVKTALDDQA